MHHVLQNCILLENVNTILVLAKNKFRLSPLLKTRNNGTKCTYFAKTRQYSRVVTECISQISHYVQLAEGKIVRRCIKFQQNAQFLNKTTHFVVDM